MEHLAVPHDWAIPPETYNEMSLNNFCQSEGLASWLDFSQSCGQPSDIGCYNQHSSEYSLADDCAYVLAADFPEVQGPLILPAQRYTTDGGYASTSSADMLNTLGRMEDNTPRVVPQSAPCPSPPEPDEEPPSVVAVDKRPSKANTRAPRRGTTLRGGRKGVVKRGAKGRGATCQGPAVTMLYRGIIGGTGTMQEQCMPWTLSLEQLNRELANSAAWPEANS